jgi:beta-glucosidase
MCSYWLGTESKALGVHVQLGPVAGPLGKIPVVRISI